jgi:uncharacterized protein YegP (UPF0339 family)
MISVGLNMSGVAPEISEIVLNGFLGCPWEGWVVFLAVLGALAYLFMRAWRRERPGEMAAPIAVATGVERRRMGRFTVYQDSGGEFRFRLIAPNNEIIAVSEGYTTKGGCMNGINSVKRHSVGRGEFEVYEDARGEFRFRLIAPNNEIIARSEGYTTKGGCMNGVDAVKRHAPDATIDDQTVSDEAPTGKFTVYQDSGGEFRFRLIAPNNEIIAVSEGYTTKAGCINGINAVKKYAASEEPNFKVYEDTGGEFRFRLIAPNNRIIAVSEGYTTKGGCMNGIDAVKRHAPDATIEDQTG